MTETPIDAGALAVRWRFLSGGSWQLSHSVADLKRDWQFTDDELDQLEIVPLVASLPANTDAGWRMVPVEPDIAMEKAAFDAVELVPNAAPGMSNASARKAIFRAMLAAAPPPPAGGKATTHNGGPDNG